MSKEQIQEYLQTNKTDRINLGNIKELHLLVTFMADSEERIRKKSAQLVFSSAYIPTDQILDFYISNPHPFIKQVIIDQLHHFVPILSKYLTKQSSFEQINDILTSQQADIIYQSLNKAYQIVPVLTTLAEIALRTCDSSVSNMEETFIDFKFITSQSKEIKKILNFRIKQSDPVYTELTLFTLTKFPELTNLIIKDVKNIINKDGIESHIKYAALALMQIDNPKNVDVLINRLKNFNDSVDTKLAIIESLGTLGNKNASEILISQFTKGEPLAYYAARSIALLGDSVLPDLINALEDDSKVPFIIESMKRIGDISYDYLMSALQKSNKTIRKNAAQCLTLVMSEKHGYEGAIRLLTTQLAGKNPSVIEAITEALLTLGTPSIKVLIMELIEDDLRFHYFGENNIELALDGLLDVETTLAVNLGLILHLYYPNEDLKKLGYSFAFSSGKLRIKNDQIFELALKSLKEIDPEIRVRSCTLLHQFGAKAVPHLNNMLTDPNIQVRRKVIESLRKIKSKRALIILTRAAKDPDDTIAEISTRALGDLKDPGVIDVIIHNMRRPKKLVRDAAIDAAVNIGAPVAKKLLAQLNAPNTNLVNSTVEALSQMDNKILNLSTPFLKTADEKWFKNLQKTVSKMGTGAKTVLLKIYKSSKNQKTKDRLLILLSLVKEGSIILDTIQKINSGEQKLGLLVLNNIGETSAKILIRELKKLTKKARDDFSLYSKGIKAEIIIPILEKSVKDSKLKDMTQSLLKNHQRTIRKYCQSEGMNYNDFVSKFSE
ncbi:MAG: HEAT repeat domain-containing protein [Candidatus Heimdallarchaeaceae archaeon]